MKKHSCGLCLLTEALNSLERKASPKEKKALENLWDRMETAELELAMQYQKNYRPHPRKATKGKGK